MNGVQTYRNPKLVHIFDKLGMIENFGTGIPRTIYSYEDYDIQPEFKITNNFFCGYFTKYQFLQWIRKWPSKYEK